MFLCSNTDAMLRGTAAISINAQTRGLYGRKVKPIPPILRLSVQDSRIRSGLIVTRSVFASLTVYRRTHGGEKGNQLQNPKIAVVRALGDNISLAWHGWTSTVAFMNVPQWAKSERSLERVNGSSKEDHYRRI